MKPRNLELHIGELVLHGFAPGDRYSVGRAVQRELTRLFADKGVPVWMAQGGELECVDGGAFEMPQAYKAEAIGTHIAQAVYGGLVK